MNEQREGLSNLTATGFKSSNELFPCPKHKEPFGGNYISGRARGDMSMIYEAGKNFIIAPATAEAAAEIRETISGGGFRWLFAGDDFARKNILAGIMPESAEFIHSGRALREIAAKIRTPYIEYIGEIAESNPERWYGLISEKNPFTSTLFMNLCVAELAQHVQAGCGSPTVLFIQSGLALDYILEHMGLVESGTAARRLKRERVSAASVGKRRIALAARYSDRIRAARSAYPSKHSLRDPKAPLTLLFSYVFPGDFDGDGKFVNHHLGDLMERLQDKGENVAAWPRILSTGQEELIYKKLVDSGVQALPSETYITTGDIVSFCGKDIFPGAAPGRTFPPFMGRDISQLIINDMLNKYSGTRELQNRIFFSAIKNWKAAGLRINKIIYPFENHSWERMMIAEARKHFPSVKIIGVQHAQLPSLMLNYFISERERSAMPLPDKIVSCGNIPAQILKSAGYDPDAIEEGPALRYQKLANMDFASIEPAPWGEKIQLLVAAAIEKSVSIELIETCISALGERPFADVAIKCHPAMGFDELFPSGKTLPGNFTVADDSIDSLIKKSHGVLYSNTTVCLEALPYHVEILHLAPQSALDMDPLEIAPEFKTDVSTPMELAAAIEKISRSEKRTIGNIEERRKFLKNYFGVVTVESVERF